MGCVAQKTICEGETYAIANRKGEVNVVEGPSRQWKCGQFFEELEKVVATEDEYILIMFRDGKSEIRRGPTSVIKHPVDHISVEKKTATRLGDQEMLVVYRPHEQQGVQRIILKGPSLYVPSTISEWVHQFSWTGASEPGGRLDESRKKRTDGLRFTKLRSIPGKMYYDVEKVRTKDNALITVKLMLFYHMENVEQMLETTNDPFADFINAVCADVIEWCSTRKFDEFLLNTDVLNTVEPYNQLKAAVLKVGFALDKVVFLGYGAQEALQRMHDKAVEKRTALALDSERAVEEQNLADFKLNKESERAAREAELEMNRLNADIEMKRQQAEASQQRKREASRTELERLTSLKKLDRGFDVGQYLLARDNKNPLVVQCNTLQGNPQ